MNKQIGQWSATRRRIVPTDCLHCANGHANSLRKLERAQAALSRAHIADNQCETLARNHALMESRSILIALNRGVEPTQPFSEVLGTVFGVGVQRIEDSIRNFERHAIELVQRDLDDLIAGFQQD